MVGYQVDFDELKAGLFLFTHSCGTTLSVCAGDFQDLYNGPIFVERLNGTESARASVCTKMNFARVRPNVNVHMYSKLRRSS